MLQPMGWEKSQTQINNKRVLRNFLYYFRNPSLKSEIISKYIFVFLF